jgi:hypothetical protein
MRSLYLILPLLVLTSPAMHAQESTGTSTVTFGVGGGWIASHPNGTGGGPAFNGTYEFRFSKYFALEAGIDTTLTTTYYSTALPIESIIPAGPGLTMTTVTGFTQYIYRGSSRSTGALVGPRLLLPVAHGHGELFAGFGAAYDWNGRSDAPVAAGAWAMQGSMGARIAVDKQRRFWLGSTGRVISEFGSGAQTRLSWTADLGFRFGH